jgi:uroporphyrinogen-III synthase
MHVRAVWEARAARPGRGTPAASFNGRRVLSLESRRSPELALLIMNYGGTPTEAPSIREVPLEENQHVVAFADAVIQGWFDMVVLMTGVGVRMLMKMIDRADRRESFLDALGRTRIVARGPKPLGALRELGLAPWVTAPSPNTWRDLLSALDAHAAEVPLTGVRVAIQEYGLPNAELIEALESRGAVVITVPIYRWAMPEDEAPLRRAVSALIDDEIEVVLLTAGIQLVHLLRVAADMNQEGAVRTALGRVVVGSIGPMTSEELRRQGLPVDFEPSHPKMGFLVKELAEQCDALSQAKRASSTVD